MASIGKRFSLASRRGGTQPISMSTVMNERPLEDWEYPEPDEYEDEDYSEVLACPACGQDVYEDSEQCPECGQYIDFTASPLSKWPWWFVALGALGIACMVLALLLG